MRPVIKCQPSSPPTNKNDALIWDLTYLGVDYRRNQTTMMRNICRATPWATLAAHGIYESKPVVTPTKPLLAHKRRRQVGRILVHTGSNVAGVQSTDECGADSVHVRHQLIDGHAGIDNGRHVGGNV